MSTKERRPCKSAKFDLPLYDYDAPGAMTRQQREERLDGFYHVLAEIFLGLTPEQRAKLVRRTGDA